MASDIPFDELTDWEQIGHGSFGNVYRCDYLGTDVAVKEFLPAGDSTKGFDLETYIGREVAILQECRHPNVLQFMGLTISDDDGRTFMVTEFVSGGSLKKLLDSSTSEMPWTLRISVALDLARAASYLASKGLVHRDIKSENVLLTSSGTAKLADFGFSRLLPGNRLTCCGTETTMAPELILALEETGAKVDVFSFGVVLCELAARKAVSPGVFDRQIPGFGIDPDEICRRAAESGRDENGVEASLQFTELAIQCTEIDPKKRPTWKTILSTLREVSKDLQSGNKQPTLPLPYPTETPGRLIQMSSQDTLSTETAWPLQIHELQSTPAPEPATPNPSPNRTADPSPGKPSPRLSRRTSIPDLITAGSRWIAGLTSPTRTSPTRTTPVTSQPDSPNKPSPTQKDNLVKHSFHAALPSLSSRCMVCLRKLPLARRSLACSDCGFVAHPLCAEEAPPTCGLSKSGFETAVKGVLVASLEGLELDEQPSSES